MPEFQAGINNLEKKAVAKLNGSDRIFLAENAWQELEVWTLAGHDDPVF